jgi:hypothetical protein
MEFALHNSPIYAVIGNTGGDICKEASDLGLPDRHWFYVSRAIFTAFQAILRQEIYQH